MEIKVYGKINLGLNITGIDGNLHTLNMINSSVDICDIITLKKSAKMSCNLSDVVEVEKNTAFIMAKAIQKEFKTENVDINIEKNIPVMAGMCGSSADGAGVLIGMKQLFQINDDKKLFEIAKSIGSDIPAMVLGGCVKVKGTGEILEKIQSKLKVKTLVVMGDFGNSSKEVYLKFDRMFKAKLNCLPSKNDALKNIEKAVISNDKNLLIDNLFNDLFEPAKNLNEQILKADLALKNEGAIKTHLFGSGSAIAGFFKDQTELEKAYYNLKNNFPFVKICEIF